ncbi:MAG: lipid-A-disaccharide synthase [Cyanobacteria bacterium TGS_CYA1]|nr:lipid-A-disaccharide synthase [Cyanobacteria bacterium TGS_CYA1]
MSKSILISVGDPSADKHAAAIIKDLKQIYPDLKVRGMGGSKMEDAGAELIYNLNDFHVIGVIEVVKHIPRILAMEERIVKEVEESKPDLVLLVDFGGFNTRLAKKLRAKFASLPILYFISPQVWASRPWRAKALARVVSKLLVIFPFEERYYEQRGIQATFVGHPLLKQIGEISSYPTREEFAKKIGFNPDNELISIFAGSRKSEIRNHMPHIILAMEELLSSRPGIQFILSMAGAELRSIAESMIKSSSVLNEQLGKAIFLIENEDNFSAMNAADVVWAKSGTTTLEVALFGKPMIIFYRGNWISYFLVILVKTIKNFGMPNILSNRQLVPELIQFDCRAQQFIRYTKDMLDVPGLRNEISQTLLSLRAQLEMGEKKIDYVKSCASEIDKFLEVASSN